MGSIGFSEIVLIFILVLVLFGPKKLPEIGRTFGKAMREFKKASREITDTFTNIDIDDDDETNPKKVGDKDV